ncbi:MAG: protein translocase SEC61 complex subunit gamma [Candidatus Parvarchaeota archaeon]|nr:protein translocase SEC61 complex subunit gamma [Candidatus Parvarchaeota archaeon]
MEEKSLADANTSGQNDNTGAAGGKVDSTNQHTSPTEGAQNGEKTVDEAAGKEDKSAKQDEQKKEQPQPAAPSAKRVERRKIDISRFGRRVKHVLGFISPGFISSKLKYYYSEYRRILLLSRKPTSKEYKELTIMVVIGTLVVGMIGFVIQLIIQFI